ncbi:hypothetical protein BV25DRAFT_1838308 [Artomyces pyxidatus]|uniref:Uncharacterized protein n=1 Tax=Artomyces pyxidatus TaxID=48021 RepID=A0ACB8T1S5_9AGAM|nr:hypothetical protein BV25DRAFT_1838308 [Artomyces pyxidatus]
MHSPAVILFLLSLLALCSLLPAAHAAPISPRLALEKRYCTGYDCRDAVVEEPSPATVTDTTIELVSEDPLLQLVDNLLLALETYKAAVSPPPPPPPSSPSSTISFFPPTSTPTSTSSRFEWFTEIAVVPATVTATPAVEA